jgi:hypothetical protein
MGRGVDVDDLVSAGLIAERLDLAFAFATTTATPSARIQWDMSVGLAVAVVGGAGRRSGYGSVATRRVGIWASSRPMSVWTPTTLPC